MTHTCAICGKVFDGHPNARVCSRKCGKKRNSINLMKIMHEYKAMDVDQILLDVCLPFVNHSKLIQCCIQAKLSGMSYGRYMAKKEGRL